MSVPFTFVNGTTADATQVNANFAAVLALTGGTLTGPLILNGAATFNAVATFNFPVTMNSVLTLAGALSVPSITYPGTEGHNIAFGWDSVAIVGHVDGTGTPGRLAAWNTSVPFASVTATSLQVNGNVVITGNTSCSTINTGGGGITTSGLQVNGNIIVTGTGSVSGNWSAATLFANAGLVVSGNIDATANISTATDVVAGGRLYCGGGGGANWRDSSGYIFTDQTIRSFGILPRSDADSSCGLAGNAWAQVASYFFNNVSDATFKTDIAPLPDCEGLLAAINPQRFRWRSGPDTEKTHWGFIAQDVAAAMKAAGYDFGGVTADPAQLGLSYNEMLAVLWRATQQQQETIKQLTDRIAVLEAKA